MYTPPVTPWELIAPETGEVTVRSQPAKVRSMTGVKSSQGSRIGRCGWITSFLGSKPKRKWRLQTEVDCAEETKRKRDVSQETKGKGMKEEKPECPKK